MDIYKEYIQRLQRLSLDDVYVILIDNFSPKLKNYICLLRDINLQDGSYQKFYGEMKIITNSFTTYYSETIDGVKKEADRCSNVLVKDDLLALMEKTIYIHKTNQIDFGREYLPITSPAEKNMYEDIEQKYNSFMEKLFKLKDKLEKFDKQHKVDVFAKNHFQLYQTRVSMEEILRRMRNNLRKAQYEAEEKLNALVDQLYDKNKEHLSISRREGLCTTETAEVNRGLDIIREKLENYEENIHIKRLEEEVGYWEKRMAEFHEAADVLTRLKDEQDNVTKQEQIYNAMQSTELPGSKYKCWETMGSNFKERKEYLKEKIVEAALTLLTFFNCRGSGRIIYADNVGPYYVDEFNHQVYGFDNNLKIYHINCDGEFKEVDENEAYYYDEAGRYTYAKGEKVYQCAPCTSSYKLTDDNLLKKVTMDCGHSEKVNVKCRLDIKDLTDVEILPMTDVMDINRTLDSEVVKYLWNSFGGLLPAALHDVGLNKPKNPIHHLAHKLVQHKYSRTRGEMKNKTMEAEEFKAKIYKERQEKAIAAAKAWKAKQVRRRKPEESDDTQDRAVFNAQIAQHDFINSLNYYY